MTKQKTKVFVIGLDGATFDLIMPWVKIGALPTLTKIINGGVRGNLKSVFPTTTPTAWASFMTGKNPGKHGIFDFALYREGTYDQVIANRKLMHGKTIWNLLTEAGKKVGVFGVPLTYPPEKVSGFLIPGMLMPTSSIPTYPPNLGKELRREIGYSLESMEYHKYVEGIEKTFLDGWFRDTEKKADATLYLMKKYDWDFFMTYFGITDQIQHFFWKFMDPQHPAHNRVRAKKFGNAIQRCYQKMDGIIGEIVRRIDNNTILIIMSDHGSGPVYKDVSINHWLRNLGLLKMKKNKHAGYLLAKLGLSQENFLKYFKKPGLLLAMKIFPKKLAADIYWGIPSRRLNLSDIDYSRTKAYSSGYLGQIFINLKGRQPYGMVDLKKEYEELRNYITLKLYGLRDPETGEKLVDTVFKKEELYWGQYVNQAPDLIFIMKGMTYVTRGAFEFNAQGTLTAPPGNLESASHRMNGTLMMMGNNVKNGIKIHNAEIIDLAPTILYILGVPIPDDIDGKVLVDAFSPHYLDSNPIRYRKVPKTERYLKQRIWSEGKEEEVRERLKSLGYL